MLGHRPTIIVSLVLALIVNTITASSGGKPACGTCLAKIEDCKADCMDVTEATCQFNCDCKIAEEVSFCRNSCGIAGPESGCPSS